MDQSGGNAQPQTGSDETAEGHPIRPTAPAADEAHPAPAPQPRDPEEGAPDSGSPTDPDEEHRSPAEPEDPDELSGESQEPEDPDELEDSGKSQEPEDPDEPEDADEPGDSEEPANPDEPDEPDERTDPRAEDASPKTESASDDRDDAASRPAEPSEPHEPSETEESPEAERSPETEGTSSPEPPKRSESSEPSEPASAEQDAEQPEQPAEQHADQEPVREPKPGSDQPVEHRSTPPTVPPSEQPTAQRPEPSAPQPSEPRAEHRPEAPAPQPNEPEPPRDRDRARDHDLGSDRGLGPDRGHDRDHTPGFADERHPERSHAVAGVTPNRATPPPRPKEPGGGILMGRPFGVPVYVGPSWFLVAALITWVFGGQLDRLLPELGAVRYLLSFFFAVAFYASVLVHELAHTVAALRFKLPVRRIQLQFFGGVSEIEKEAETPGREFVLAFVGPLFSLVLAAAFYGGLRAVEPATVPGVLLAGLMVSNLLVAAFNLLPGLPLDGGRMLRAVVWKITGRPMAGTVAAAWIGRVLAVAVLVGLPLFTQTGRVESRQGVGMDTVTDALLAAILAAIIWTGAGSSLRMARLREHLPELRARTLTRRAIPVAPPTPLSEALRRANAAGARALVVVDSRGEPLSLVREAAIVGVPEHRRPWVAVSSLSQDIDDGMRVSAELAGEELLDVLRATPATEYLVVEETGEIYGVLSAGDVERAFVKAMARPGT